MSVSRPTSHAVAAAIMKQRKLQGLSRQRLAAMLATGGHQLGAHGIGAIERGEAASTVDDLVALAYALEVTPNELLVPPQDSVPEFDGGPVATGLPADVFPDELSDWLNGAIRLDDASRALWWDDQRRRVALVASHLEDQMNAAVEELEELEARTSGEASMRKSELDARIQKSRLAMNEVQRAQDAIAIRLGELQGPE